MSKFLSVVAVALTGAAFAVPSVEIVGTPTQDENGDLVVSYKLTDAPAIVTFDVETNGVTIGDANVYRRCPPSGEVSRLVKTDGTYVVKWNVDSAWPTHPSGVSLRGVVLAWDPSDPPDYLVADLMNEKDVRYYTSENALPGGLMENEAYRMSKLVMRRIHSRGVTWKMGTSAAYHNVTMNADYYLGVFPITQGQWYAFRGLASHVHEGYACRFINEGCWAKRIADNLHYNFARVNIENSSDDPATYYPAAPGENSYLGRLRRKTGVDFDLPGEAQWEFACRCGIPDMDVWSGLWNDGTTTIPGRCKDNGGLIDGSGAVPSDCGPDQGCPVAGMYNPSRWGIYDMHGGVMEFCLDWYQADISALTEGQVNADGSHFADGTGSPDTRVTRGGCWFYAASSAGTTVRSYSTPNDGGNVYGGGGRGFRVACPVPAEK